MGGAAQEQPQVPLKSPVHPTAVPAVASILSRLSTGSQNVLSWKGATGIMSAAVKGMARTGIKPSAPCSDQEWGTEHP